MFVGIVREALVAHAHVAPPVAVPALGHVALHEDEEPAEGADEDAAAGRARGRGAAGHRGRGARGKGGCSYRSDATRDKIMQARRNTIQKEQKARVDVLCSVLAPSMQARARQSWYLACGRMEQPRRRTEKL